MRLYLYQIIVSLLSFFMLYQGFSNFIQGKKGQNFLKLLVRIVVWGGMALVALFPSFSNVIAKNIGIAGNVNAVILTGFILVFLMIFKLLSAIERLEQQITELTRENSLNKLKKD